MGHTAAANGATRTELGWWVEDLRAERIKR